MKLNTNYTFYSIVIFTIVFDLTFAETLVIDTPLLIILTTIKKMFGFIFNNVDPHIYRLTAAYIHLCMEYRQQLVLYLRFISNVGNTTYSRGNTECCSPLKLHNSTAMIFKLYLICSQYLLCIF